MAAIRGVRGPSGPGVIESVTFQLTLQIYFDQRLGKS